MVKTLTIIAATWAALVIAILALDDMFNVNGVGRVIIAIGATLAANRAGAPLLGRRARRAPATA